MTNSTFARHGITHLSASSLNLWRENPGLWSVRYLGQVRDDGNAAMWRGSAVEDGLKVLLHGGTPEAAIEAASRSFLLNSQGVISDDIDAERELIAQMVGQCKFWTPPGPLNASQLKVEYYFDSIHIPVIGYLDFAFEDGQDVDLKTTKACPSTPRPDHVRQVSLYRAARGRKGGLLYVTGKRHAYFEVDDDARDRALGDLESCALSLQSFLARVNTPQEAMRCLPMNTDHYAFSEKAKVSLSEILLAG